MKALSWKPRRKGDTYCSPACGNHCTKAAFDLAHKRGAALAKRCGKGWSYKVWENLGWHYEATALGGIFNVHRFNVGYWADLHINGTQYQLTRPDPRGAIEAVLNAAKQQMFAIEKVIYNKP